MPRNNQSKNKTPFPQKILLLFLGFFVALIILELSLSFCSFIMFSVKEYRNQQSIARKGVYRILCVGESMTHNHYPRFLGNALSRSPGGVVFGVIDKGLPGANSTVILDRMEACLAAYHPDMVIAMMGSNDHYSLYYEGIPEATSMLFKHCRVYRLMRMFYRRLLEKLPSDSVLHVPVAPASKNNTQTPYYSSHGRAYMYQGKFALAEEAYKQGIAADPKNPLCYGDLGDLYVHQGKLTLAEEIYKQGIAAGPQDSRCYADLGFAYFKHGKLFLAEEAYRQGLAVYPKDVRCYLGLGGVYQKQNRLPLLEECFLKGIQYLPSEDRLYGALALLYEKKGQKDLALKYYREAEALRLKRINPVTAANYLKLKELLSRRGVKLVCMQYPMRSIAPLKSIFAGKAEGIIFVDNEEIFKGAVKKDGYNAYFKDVFAGDFGHCTDKGDKLIAENIAQVLSKEVFAVIRKR